VAILYKPSLKLATSSTDDVGRLVIAQFLASTSDSTPFQVVNVYGPNSRQPGEQFFSAILPQIDPAIHSILCGDFNTVVNPQLDRI
jgi:exonuclease III